MSSVTETVFTEYGRKNIEPGFEEEMKREALKKPDEAAESHYNLKIAHPSLNRKILRVLFKSIERNRAETSKFKAEDGHKIGMNGLNSRKTFSGDSF